MIGSLKLGLTSLGFRNNPGQNVWNKIEKFSKIGHGKKSLICTFACFFKLLLPNINFWKIDLPLGYVSALI